MISAHFGSMQFFFWLCFFLPSKQCYISSSQISELRPEKHNVMVFLYVVLHVFLIRFLQHYVNFLLTNKWLAHVPACFAALDDWFWLCFLLLLSEFNPRLHSHILMYRIQLQHITRWVDLLSTEFIVLSWKLLRCNFMIYYFIFAYGFSGKIIFQLCPPMVYIPQLFKRWIMPTISG